MVSLIEQPPENPNAVYISSSDTLCGTVVDQQIKPGWNDRHPLFLYTKEEEAEILLRGMLRQGIPPTLRCAVWISSIVDACNPHQSEEYSDQYRTIGMAQVINAGWETVVKQIFPDSSDLRDALPPNFGNTTHLQYQQGKIGDQGTQALAHVLCGIEQFVGLDFCPLVPPLAAMFLRYMSEPYAFYAIREMTHEAPYFFPITQLEHQAWCRTFIDILKRLHPQTAGAMEHNGSLTPDGLEPIFRHFFLPIMPYESVLRILDIYTLEGHKVIFRFGVALCCMFKKYMLGAKKQIDTRDQWWQQLREYTHSRIFRFDILCKKAYGYHGNKLRKRLRFPRRRILERIIKLEKDRAESEMQFEEIATPPRPLGLMENDNAVLAKEAAFRSNLAKWLTPSLRLTKLDLVYSTNVHGRTLDLFYQHLKGCKQTILLCEVLDNNSTIGVFASHEWKQSSKIYGDGECFLFRLHPDPQCWKWKPDSNVSCFDEVGSETSDSTPPSPGATTGNNNKSIALMEQFMVGHENFMSMGGNDSGGSGFRLNEDLTRGESSEAKGFNNEALPMLGNFEVGVVEVYQLARAIDGKTVQQVIAESFRPTL